MFNFSKTYRPDVAQHRDKSPRIGQHQERVQDIDMLLQEDVPMTTSVVHQSRTQPSLAHQVHANSQLSVEPMLATQRENIHRQRAVYSQDYERLTDTADMLNPEHNAPNELKRKVVMTKKLETKPSTYSTQTKESHEDFGHGMQNQQAPPRALCLREPLFLIEAVRSYFM